MYDLSTSYDGHRMFCSTEAIGTVLAPGSNGHRPGATELDRSMPWNIGGATKATSYPIVLMP